MSGDDSTTDRNGRGARPFNETPEAEEMFVLLGWAWDITAAKRLADRYPVGAVSIPRVRWLLAVIRIDESCLDHVDLTIPVLTVPIPGADAPMIIDGWHRIARAVRDGIDKLPAVLLDEHDERICRIRGGGIVP